MRYIFTVFIFIGLISCSGQKVKINDSQFDMDYGLRHRVYDEYEENTIAFWISASDSMWDEVERITVLVTNTTLYTLNHIKDIYTPLHDLIFFQCSLEMTNLLNYPFYLQIETENIIYQYPLNGLESIDGNIAIKELENKKSLSSRMEHELTIAGMEDGFGYNFKIYGPDNLLIFSSNIISPNIKLDISLYHSGEYLIGIYKLDENNQYNLLSREYTINIDREDI